MKVQLCDEVPEQASPLQPTNLPADGEANSVMLVPAGKVAVHVEPQLIPGGLLVTVPFPSPDLIVLTVSVKVSPPPPEVLNVAVTVVFAVSVIVAVPVPEVPPPLQPAKTEPEAGVAVKVTTVPDGKDLEQVEPQSIPAGLLVTVPVPVPDLFTVRVTPPPELLNIAVTVVFAVSVIVAVPVPEVPPPLQPAKTEPGAGVAVKVTTVPDEKDLEQVEPQLIPDGLLVTVPAPVPDFSTWSVTERLP
ncbi:MAG TPA: hypothetical protein VFP58_11155 [Candidatus Eisenbacteria bacterium]|nr:hypothetical protein [Candidatus Eisenbacteria bacterium]